MISIKTEKGNVDVEMQMTSKDELIGDVASIASNFYKHPEMLTLLQMIMYLLFELKEKVQETAFENVQIAEIEITDEFEAMLEKFREQTNEIMEKEKGGCSCGKCFN